MTDGDPATACGENVVGGEHDRFVAVALVDDRYLPLNQRHLGRVASSSDVELRTVRHDLAVTNGDNERTRLMFRDVEQSLSPVEYQTPFGSVVGDAYDTVRI